jgi:uncharacterized protein YggE
MARTFAKTAVAIFVVLVASGVCRAQFQAAHVITVSSNSQVFARPDLGILILTIQSSAPLAADALRQNTRKAGDVQAALAALGYSADSFKISPAVFTRAGGRYYPDQPSVTGIQAEQFIYVFFGSDQLKDQSQLGQRVAATIDALTKSGAAAANPFPQQQTAMVVYTVKDPLPYEGRALQEALGRARDGADAIAKKMGVEISGLHSVSTGFLRGGVVGGVITPYPQAAQNALAELPYHFYSTRADQVAITADATVNYDLR